MIPIREEGWKEVKMATFSQVELLEPTDERRRRAQREGKRRQEDVVGLSDHSYCAGVWDADTFGAYQYAEGLRRGFDLLGDKSSVNDGAPWIERIAGMNFPRAKQIVDWGHSKRRLWAVAHAIYGEGKPEAAAWVKRRKDELWESGARNVVQPRMRRPGRGWRRENAQAMLAALGELHSGRFRWAWGRTYCPDRKSCPIF